MNKRLTTLLLCIALPSWANSISIGSYVETTGEPTEQQLNPIKTVASFEFPNEIQHVGEAIRMVLDQAGYRVDFARDDAKSAYVLFNFSLPAVHRSLGPMTVEDILQSLAGPAYRVQVNQLYRSVSFVAGESLDPAIVQQEQIRWQEYMQLVPTVGVAESGFELIRVEM